MSTDNQIFEKDLLWCFFNSALHSYRYDSVLRPFPSNYVREGRAEKDIVKLRNDVIAVPSVQTIVNRAEDVSQQTLDLFEWVVSLPSFKLKLKSKDTFDLIKKLTGQVTDTSSPDYVFEVIPSHQNEQKFQALRKDDNIFYAYHGSRLDNFHSILHSGLVAHLNKNALFGSGIYLSSDLSVSLHYSPSSMNWSKSQLGDQLSCVAVCEVIDNESVKCHTEDENQASRSYISDSMAGKVPEKYFIVQNNEAIRVRYLLLYAKTSSIRRRNRWWSKYKFEILMCSYCILLLAIGLSSSNVFRNVRKIFF